MVVHAQRFRARWSPATWIVTIAVSAIVAIALAHLLWSAVVAVPDDMFVRVMFVVAAVVIGGTLIAVSLFAPLGYIVDSEAVTIRRVGRDVTIPRSGITEVRRLASRDVGFAWRLCGSGGFLGSFGYFYSRPLGRFHAYVTNSIDLVLVVRTDGARIVISPFPPEEFIRSVQQFMESGN